MDQIVVTNIRIPELLMQCASAHLTYFDHQFKAIVAALTDLDNVVGTKRHNKATSSTHCSKPSFFVQKFNFHFPRKLSKFFWVKKS